MRKKDSSVLKVKDFFLKKKNLPIYSKFRSQLNSNIKKNSFLIFGKAEMYQTLDLPGLIIYKK